MELSDFNCTLIIALIASILAVLFIILAILYCLRRKNSTPYKRAPIIKSSSDESKSSILKDKNQASVINLPDRIDGLNNLTDENYDFLGVSLNEIPFIDDSKCNSYIDLTWNPYQPLTNKS